MNVLVIGANGQLGSDFQKLLLEKGIPFTSCEREQLDITNKDQIDGAILGSNFTHIVNCAAYNNVDLAEKNDDLCRAVNTIGPSLLAAAANRVGAVFISYSTDFVFSGDPQNPYNETMETNPISKYGLSKRDGEILIFKECQRAFVIRTSWVFGSANSNFNTQIINWSRSNSTLKIVDDQTSSPTYSKDLAKYSLLLIESEEYGMYHLSNSGTATKYDQASYILKNLGWTGSLERAKTSEFNLAAKRPVFSKLDCSKAEKVIGLKMPHWQDAIDRYLTELKNTGDL